MTLKELILEKKTATDYFKAKKEWPKLDIKALFNEIEKHWIVGIYFKNLAGKLDSIDYTPDDTSKKAVEKLVGELKVEKL